MKKAPSVLLVTPFPFWALGDGQRMRVLALLWVLTQRTDVTVLYLGSADHTDIERLRQLRVRCDFRATGVLPGPDAQAAAVRQLCAGKQFDACIVERLLMDHIRTAVPSGVRTVLDAHDLLSDHAASRRSRGLEASAITLEHELERFARYDCVMLIQEEEHAMVAERVASTVLLAPHPVNFPCRPVRPGSRVLGLVASGYEANLHGLDWFADHVWPRLAGKDVSVHIFGHAGEAWRPGSQGDFMRHGFVADYNRVWGAMDVAINPVRWGSGLKIKNVEALGNGMPLVTTNEGARGIRRAAGEAFVLAEDAQAFADACLALLDDPERRGRMGQSGHAYAARHFSPQACFGALLDWLAA